jgi:hypothetical protein
MDVTNNFGTDEWVDLAIFYNLSLIVLEPGDFTEDLTPPNGFNSYWEQSVLIPAGKTVTKSMKVMVGIGTGPTPSITGGDQPIFGEAILVDPPNTSYTTQGSIEFFSALLIDGTQGGTTISQALDDFGGDQDDFDALSYSVLVLNGKLTIDEDFNLGLTNEKRDWYMAQGSQVLIEEFAHLQLKEVDVQGCGHMWKGFEANANSTTSIYAPLGDRNTIRDAEIALQVNNGATVNLRQTDFINNYLGLYIPPATPSGSNEIDLNGLWGLSFETDGDFLAPFSGQSLLPSDVGFAGVEIHDMPAISLSGIPFGPSSTFRNYFRNLANGVLAYRSTLNIRNTEFENITTNGDYLISGRAISLESTPFLPAGGTLFQEGLGDDPTSDDPSFQNCHTAIYLQNADAEIKNNYMDGVKVGVANRFGYLREVNVKENAIITDSLGIHSLINMQTVGRVDNNTIRVNENNLTSPVDIGAVICNEFPLHTNWWISNNLILLGKARDGIFIRTAEDNRVRQNTVTMDFLNTSGLLRYNGIYMEGSPFGIITCNAIEGNASLSAGSVDYKEATGITLLGSSSTLNACNDLDDTRYGIQVFGMCDGSVVRGNELNDHRSGLILGEYEPGGNPNGNAFLGQQVHEGNRWEVLYDDVAVSGDGRYGAVHLAENFNIINESRFFVDNIENPRFNPEVDLPFYTGPNQDFVLDEFLPSLSFSCTTANTCSGEGPGYQGFTTPLDDRIAEDSLVTDGHNDGLSWTARRHLYRRYLREPALAPGTGSVLDSFFVEAPGESAGAYEDWMVDLRAALQPDSSQSAQMVGLRGDIRLQIEVVYTQDSLLQSGLSTPDSLAALAARSTALDSLQTLAQSMESLRTTLTDSLATSLSALSTANLSLSATATYESNQRTVNRILTDLLANGTSALDSTARSQLESIAGQCAFSGGDAVFLARALLDKRHYDDADLCSLSGRESQLPQSAKEIGSLTFRPNPASGEVILDLPAMETGTWQLDLLDAQGRQVGDYQFGAGQTQAQISLQGFSPGLYYARLIGQNQTLYIGRLIIQ